VKNEKSSHQDKEKSIQKKVISLSDQCSRSRKMEDRRRAPFPEREAVKGSGQSQSTVFRKEERVINPSVYWQAAHKQITE